MENTATPPAHTPTPWTIEDARREEGAPWKGNAWDGFMIRAEGGLIGVAYVEANVAFIVRACNVHAELITALKDALFALDVAKSRDPGQAGIYHCPLARRVIAQAAGR